jgi:hypothetical protein
MTNIATQSSEFDMSTVVRKESIPDRLARLWRIAAGLLRGEQNHNFRNMTPEDRKNVAKEMLKEIEQ